MPDESKTGTTQPNADAGTKVEGADAAAQKSAAQAPPNNVVTVDYLKAWGDASTRKVKEMVDSVAQQQAAFREEITKTLEALKPPPEAEDAKARKSQAVPELIDLRKALEGATKKNSELEKVISQMAERERSYRFQTIVKEALNRQGCIKTEQAFRVISPDLKLDENGQRVFATVDLEGNTVELDVDKYVESVVKEKVLPEFFSGNHRPGSPAAGGGVSGKDYDFTIEQVRDTEFYAANREKIAEALAKGRVKMK